MGAGPPKASTRLHTNVDINGIGGSRNIHRMGGARQDFPSLLSGYCCIARSENKWVRPAGG